MKRAVCAGLLALTMTAGAAGAALDPAQVPADAKWIIHIDLEALRSTALADTIRQQQPEAVSQMRRWLQDEYGIDPQEDLFSLLLFGNSYQAHTGVMVLTANFDTDKVTAKINEQPNVTRDEWQGHTLYTLTVQRRGHDGHGGHGESDSNVRSQQPGGQSQDGLRASQSERRQSDATHPSESASHERHSSTGDSSTQTVTIALLDGKHAVFASSPELAQSTVQLLEGDAASQDGGASELIKEVPEGTILYGAAIDLQQIARREAPFPVLKQHDRITYYVGVRDDQVVEDITLVAQSPEVAEQMAKVLEGCVAFLQVWAADNPALKKITEQAEIERQDRTVHARFQANSQDVVAALQAIKERVQMAHDEQRETQAR